MHAHCLQHVSFEGLGSIERWLDTQGYETTSTCFFESSRLPDPSGLDLIIVLGGPMSANDEDKFSWLVDEKRFVRKCIQQGKRVLGICLGAQLIASAIGARVYPNPVKEIGWFPVQAVFVRKKSLFRFPPLFEAFHWHGETFDLPPGAIRIAKSEGCENQAFQLGQSVMGLQFHLEVTPEAVRKMVLHGRTELSPAKFVQSEGAILERTGERCRELNELMTKVLFFLKGHDG